MLHLSIGFERGEAPRCCCIACVDLFIDRKDANEDEAAAAFSLCVWLLLADAAMQFTELSELNKVVGMMRIASCNSPTFHDRQDSEVDRIFNSSPKMEMQLRNSWIDKMASFKPMGTANGGSNSTTATKKTTTPVTNGVANGTKSANGVAADAARASSKKPVADENDTRAGNKADNGKETANGGADAKQRRMSAAPGKAAKGTALPTESGRLAVFIDSSFTYGVFV